MDTVTAERVARNQATFRDANERIVSAADQIGVPQHSVPFICECADPSCTQVLLIDLAEYSAVRRHPRRFLHAIGHRDDSSTIVEMHRHYVVAEKTGAAGEIAEELA